MKHVVAGILFFTMTGCAGTGGLNYEPREEVWINTYNTNLTQERAFDRVIENVVVNYNCANVVVQHKDRDAGLILIKASTTKDNLWSGSRTSDYALIIRTAKDKVRIKQITFIDGFMDKSNVAEIKSDYETFCKGVMAYIKQDVSLR